MEIDHRVGYVRPGYDADIVIWNSHPLSVGATPLQVYIDGKSTLDPTGVRDSLLNAGEKSLATQQPQMRNRAAPEIQADFCKSYEAKGGKVVFTGIRQSFLRDWPSTASDEDLTMILTDGKITCLGATQDCVSTNSDRLIVALEKGYVAPGLIAITNSLGLGEIATLPDTTDGEVSNKLDPLDPENVDYAKYGIHLEGKAFRRAQYGGVTKAITHPMNEAGAEGLLSGISVGIQTSGNHTLLDGGIFQDDVALHFVIGQGAKGQFS